MQISEKGFSRTLRKKQASVSNIETLVSFTFHFKQDIMTGSVEDIFLQAIR